MTDKLTDFGKCMARTATKNIPPEVKDMEAKYIAMAADRIEKYGFLHIKTSTTQATGEVKITSGGNTVAGVSFAVDGVTYSGATDAEAQCLRQFKPKPPLRDAALLKPSR